MNKLITIKDSLRILEKDGLVLYTTDKLFDSSQIIKDNNGEYTSEKLLKQEVRHRFFITKSSISKGVEFPTGNIGDFKYSSLQEFLGTNFSFDEKMFYSENDSLVSTYRDLTHVTEKYIPLDKKDVTYPDSTILYFEKQNNIKCLFSLAPLLEKEKRMLLKKAVFIYNPDISDKVKSEIVPRREFVFEIRTPAISTESLLPFLKKAGKMI